MPTNPKPRSGATLLPPKLRNSKLEAQKTNTLSVTNHPPETALIDRCLRGDRFAQMELYHRYSKAMYNICTRMMGLDAEAQDALQDAFVRAFTNLSSYKADAAFGAWLKRIVINTCITALKKRNANPWLSIEHHEEVLHTEEEDAADLRLNPGVIHRAIKQLPDGSRTVFTLHVLEGYDHEEISQILGISKSTSKSQLHRAKALLRTALEKTTDHEKA